VSTSSSFQIFVNKNQWITYLLHPSSASTLLNYNLASGGATTDASLVKPYQSTVLPLIDQVSLFTKNLSPLPSNSLTASNTLIGIWIGVNDVGNAWSNANWPTLSQKNNRSILHPSARTLCLRSSELFILDCAPDSEDASGNGATELYAINRRRCCWRL
jgi:hypothetical protein